MAAVLEYTGSLGRRMSGRSTKLYGVPASLSPEEEALLAEGVAEREGAVIGTELIVWAWTAAGRRGLNDLGGVWWNLPRNSVASELGRWDSLGFHSVGSRSDLPSWALGGILAERVGRGVGRARSTGPWCFEATASVSLSSPEAGLLTGR